MKFSLKTIATLVSVLMVFNVAAQQGFSMADFSNNLNKIIAAKRQGFKPFFKAGNSEVDKSKFVELFKGGSNQVFRTRYEASINVVTKQGISLDAFKAALKKAYLPNECIITEQEGTSTNEAFHLKVIEKGNGYYNTNGDFYNVVTERMANGNQSITFEIWIHAEEKREIIFNTTAFVNQMKEIIADQKTGWKSFRNGKDQIDSNGYTFFLKKKVWGAVKSELAEGMNDDSTGLDSYFRNYFKFLLPPGQKFDYNTIRKVLQSIYPIGTYDYSLVDSSTEGNEGLYVRLRLVKLLKNSFIRTGNRFDFDISTVEGANYKELLIQTRINHFANQNDEGKTDYWSGNGGLANDSLKKILGQLYVLAKRNRLDSLPSTVLKETDERTWGDFSFMGDAQKLTKTNLTGYSFYRGSAGEFAIVKKLSNDPAKHAKEWMDFIIQVGNALPRKFIYMQTFHEKIMVPYIKTKRINLKPSLGSTEMLFMEVSNYELFADALMSASTSVSMTEDEKERKTFFATINFTVN